MSLLLLSQDSGASVVPGLGSDGIVVIVPYGPARHTLEWNTNILKTWSGREQRISLVDLPRERFSAELLLTNDIDLRELRAHLFRRPSDVYLLPLRQEGLSSLTTYGGTSLSVDTTHSDWIVVGRRVLVQGPAGAYKAVVQSLSPGTPGLNTMTLDASPPTTFPAGSTYVYPLMQVHLEDLQVSARYPVNAGRWTLGAWALDPAPAFGTGAPTIATHEGIPILDRQPLNNSLVMEQDDAGLAFLEYGATHTVRWGRTEADILRAGEWRFTSNAERQWWKKFLGNLLGRQKLFLLPTWRMDFPFFAVATGTTIQVAVTSTFNYINDWWPSLAHRRLRIQNASGAFAYARVLSVLDGGTTQTLTIDTNISGLNPNFISFLETVRLSEDAVQYEYERHKTSVALTCRVVQEV